MKWQLSLKGVSAQRQMVCEIVAAPSADHAGAGLLYDQQCVEDLSLKF